MKYTSSLIMKLPRAPAVTYRVMIGNGLFQQLPDILSKLRPVSRYVIITDSVVKKIYGVELCAALRSAGLRVDLLSLPAGEKNKNEKTHSALLHGMLRKKCGRDTMILALGGGVVGDIAGYVAAVYMRGIPYVQIPTSFLAMVDSSLGGKVGVDTEFGKNLIGAFWHPDAVIADVDFLDSLSREQLISGLMEAVKIFLTYDKKYFELVCRQWDLILKKDSKFLRSVISRAIELKIGVVQRDEHESNERMVVNFGHTIGHAIEQLSGYTILHGYGVALGVLVESKMAHLMGALSEKDFLTVRDAMRRFGIDERFIRRFSVSNILKQTLIDKKSRNNKIRYVLLERIGKAMTKRGIFGHEVDINIVRQALYFFHQ